MVVGQCHSPGLWFRRRVAASLRDRNVCRGRSEGAKTASTRGAAGFPFAVREILSATVSQAELDEVFATTM